MARTQNITLVLTISLLLAIPITSFSPRRVIAKEGLLKALAGKLTGKKLIRRVREDKVNFRLNPEVEQEIRHKGKYLGEKGLDELVSTVRTNYFSPSPTQEPQEKPAYPVEEIRWVAEAVPSQRNVLPWGLQVTVQTNVPISPTHIRIECDGAIGDSDFGFAGPTSAMFNVQVGHRGNLFELYFGGPAFTPQTPLVVKLYSVAKIRALSVSHIH